MLYAVKFKNEINELFHSKNKKQLRSYFYKAVKKAAEESGFDTILNEYYDAITSSRSYKVRILGSFNSVKENGVFEISFWNSSVDKILNSAKDLYELLEYVDMIKSFLDQLIKITTVYEEEKCKKELEEVFLEITKNISATKSLYEKCKELDTDLFFSYDTETFVKMYLPSYDITIGTDDFGDEKELYNFANEDNETVIYVDQKRCENFDVKKVINSVYLSSLVTKEDNNENRLNGFYRIKWTGEVEQLDFREHSSSNLTSDRGHLIRRVMNGYLVGSKRGNWSGVKADTIAEAFEILYMDKSL